jgi:hypothetical protein
MLGDAPTSLKPRSLAGTFFSMIDRISLITDGLSTT